MKKIFVVLLLAAASAHAAKNDDTGHSKISGVYRIYGGGLVDSTAPTRTDKKIMFSLTGQVARDMFEAMGPDTQNECSSRDGTRYRSKDNGKVLCMRSSAGSHSCNFGFQLRTGKSIGGIAC